MSIHSFDLFCFQARYSNFSKSKSYKNRRFH